MTPEFANNPGSSLMTESEEVFASLERGDNGARDKVYEYLRKLTDEANTELSMIAERMRRSPGVAPIEEFWMVSLSTAELVTVWSIDARRAKEAGIDPALIDEDILRKASLEPDRYNFCPILDVLNELKGIEYPGSNLFTPLSLTEDGLAVVSPLSTLLKEDVYYDQILDKFPFIADWVTEDIELLFDKGIIPEGPIVDIGCGTGVLVGKLREKGYSAYGIEIIKNYGQGWRDRGIETYCYVGNLESLPGVKDSSFALVVTNVFWDSVFGTHGQGGVNDPRRCVEEINRILMPGGGLLMLGDAASHGERLAKHAKLLGLSEQKIDSFFEENKVFNKPYKTCQ